MQNFAGGGAEKVVCHLANAILAEGAPVHLVVGTESGPYRHLVDPAVQVISLDQPNIMLTLPRFLAYCERERPRGVISALNQPSTIACWAKKKTGLPTLIVIQNNLSAETKGGTGWKIKFMPWFGRRYFPLADRILGVSKGVAEDAQKLLDLPPEKMGVIYNPVVTPEMIQRSFEEVEHPWFHDGGPPVVLGVGRFHVQKDFPNLLRAFAMARAQRPMRLLLLGEGDERKNLETLAETLNLRDSVQMPGFVKNPYAYFRRAAAYALSSRWEGLPTVVIESLACGARIVATNCPSGPDEILHHGKYGILVPVGDERALADGILNALSSPPPNFGPEAYEPYMAHTVARQYLQALEDAR
jgi:glycosyltransferase involved in cell wall biosynthesis